MSDWPAEFEYLKSVALRFGKSSEWHEIRDFALGLSLEEQAEIRNCYEEILARQDLESIGDWLSKHGTSSWDETQLGNAFRLILLFDVMGKIGLLKPLPEPASHRSPVPLNWSSLPKELTFLIGAAKRYGRMEPGAPQEELIRWLRLEEIQHLNQLAMRLHKDDQIKLLEHWMCSHETRLFPEAIRVRNLYELLRRIESLESD